MARDTLAGDATSTLRGVRTTGVLWLRGFWAFSKRNPLGGLAALFILTLVVTAIFAPLIAPNDPDFIFRGARFAGVGHTPEDGKAMLLGGDQAGRDLFARVVFGSRIALMVGAVAAGIGVGSGLILGLVAGYFGGKMDLVISRVIDTLMAFPALILALLIMSILDTGTMTAMIAIGIVFMPLTARVVRGAALSVKENVYVESAKAIGATTPHIIARYILPNVAHTVIIIGATLFAGAILVEASLSFLGIGTSTQVASWGVMIAGPGRSALQSHPMILFAPAVALSVSVLAFNLLGDALRDAWDPRLRS